MTPKTNQPARPRARRRPSTDFYETMPLSAPGGRLWNRLGEQDISLPITASTEEFELNPRAAEATAKRFAMIVLLLTAVTMLALAGLLIAGLQTAQHTLPPVSRPTAPQL